jgi:hypothetical protein
VTMKPFRRGNAVEELFLAGLGEGYATDPTCCTLTVSQHAIICPPRAPSLHLSSWTI